MVAKKKRKYLLMLLPLIAGCGLYYFMFGTANRGEIIDQKPGTELSNPASFKDKQLNGQHIQLTYRGIYLQSQQPTTSPDLESYRLTAGTTYVKQVVVIVSELPDGQLSQNSGYLLRKNRTDLYKLRLASVNERPLEVWESIDGQEQTVFLQQGNKLATLVFVQQGGEMAGLSTEVESLLKSFSWR